MNSFTIKDLENLSGIKAHTIRIWEQRHGFLKPNRTDTNIRFYSGEELRMLLNVSLLNKNGFKISKISKMNLQEMENAIKNLDVHHVKQTFLINNLIQHMVEMEVEAFEQLLDGDIEENGIESTILNIIFPFLKKLGMLWLSRHINPAHEHLAANVIRQKIIHGIESMEPIDNGNQTAMLFLPENEHHELGLLYIYFLLKKKGKKVLYLGTNIPLKDAKFAVQCKNPSHIFTHLTTLLNDTAVEKYLIQAADSFGQVPMLVSGATIKDFDKKIPETILIKKSLKEVTDFIEAL